MSEHVLYSLTSAGTTLTNSTTETELAGYSIPANGMQPGKIYRITWNTVTASSNSTDTLVVKLKFGGTAVFTSAAVDQANSDVCVGSCLVQVRDADASSTVYVAGVATPSDATGTAAVGFGATVASIDATAAVAISLTGTWSVAHADNQVAAQLFVVTELV